MPAPESMARQSAGHQGHLSNLIDVPDHAEVLTAAQMSRTKGMAVSVASYGRCGAAHAPHSLAT